MAMGIAENDIGSTAATLYYETLWPRIQAAQADGEPLGCLPRLEAAAATLLRSALDSTTTTTTTTNTTNATQEKEKPAAASSTRSIKTSPSAASKGKGALKAVTAAVAAATAPDVGLGLLAAPTAAVLTAAGATDDGGGGGGGGEDAAQCALSDLATLLRCEQHVSVHEVMDSGLLPSLLAWLLGGPRRDAAAAARHLGMLGTALNCDPRTRNAAADGAHMSFDPPRAIFPVVVWGTGKGRVKLPLHCCPSALYRSRVPQMPFPSHGRRS